MVLKGGGLACATPRLLVHALSGVFLLLCWPVCARPVSKKTVLAPRPKPKLLLRTHALVMTCDAYVMYPRLFPLSCAFSKIPSFLASRPKPVPLCSRSSSDLSFALVLFVCPCTFMLIHCVCPKRARATFVREMLHTGRESQKGDARNDVHSRHELDENTQTARNVFF